MMEPLWLAENKTQFSSVFSVAPGKAVLLHAVGLEQWAFRVDATTPRQRQMLCVRRVLHGFDKVVYKTAGRCDWVFDVDNTKGYVLADDLVCTNGCSWSLSSSNMLGVIALPGAYRLELNDATAIGVAQVYAEEMSLSHLAPSMYPIVFA